MKNSVVPDIFEAKRKIRVEARRLRRELADKDRRSRSIAQALRNMPEYQNAQTVMFYVDMPDEVRTRALIEESLRENRRVAVPYCRGERLGLFLLKDMSELAPGMLGIGEPLPRLRDLAERAVDGKEIDLVITPGIAFDAGGGRIGHGIGYYDRFLKTLGNRCRFIALAYQCQIFPSIPTVEHDVPMDAIVTEDTVYRVDKERDFNCE